VSATATESAQDYNRPLTERELGLLRRLLSDPFSFPIAFKAWHVRSLELSDLMLLRSNVRGLDDALVEAGEQNLVGGLANLTTDPSGLVHVSFPAPVATVRAINLTNASGAHANVNFSALNWVTGGFDIYAWNLPANAPLANTAISVSWLAFITPLT